MPVPYNLEIELAIMSKSQDDGLQILEQILPNFHPSMNVSIEVIDTTKEERDIAIVLNGVGYQDDYEGDFTQRRTLLWTLNFTVKTYLFGPISAQRDIRKVQLDYRTDIKTRPAELRYSAEVASTDEPPIPRDDIDPATDNYKVVETYEDIYSPTTTSSDWIMAAFDELNDAFDIKPKEEETLDITPVESNPLKKRESKKPVIPTNKQKTARKTISMPVVNSTTW